MSLLRGNSLVAILYSVLKFNKNENEICIMYFDHTIYN